MIIDDYGHHPQEIISTIDAFRKAWPNKRLLHVFQPHRYTRTQALFGQFAQALSLSDELMLLDIYSAGESPIQGVSSLNLLEAIKVQQNHARLVNDGNLVDTLNDIVNDGDVILMQGAGSVGLMAQKLIQNAMEQA